MRPPGGGLIVLSGPPADATSSFTILGVLAVSPEPSVNTRALGLRHAHTGCLRPRTHPADTSAAWRPSPHTVLDLALEPQPHPGAFPAAAAGPARRAAVTAPHSVKAALSNARGIAAAREVTADLISASLARDWRREAKRPRRIGLCSEVADDGENLEDHPALATSYVRREAPVSVVPTPLNSSRPR